MFSFPIHVQVFSSEISLCRLEYSYSCISSHFCLQVFAILIIFMLSLLFVVAVISFSLLFSYVVLQISYLWIHSIFNAGESSSSFFT